MGLWLRKERGRREVPLQLGVVARQWYNTLPQRACSGSDIEMAHSMRLICSNSAFRCTKPTSILNERLQERRASSRSPPNLLTDHFSESSTTPSQPSASLVFSLAICRR